MHSDFKHLISLYFQYGLIDIPNFDTGLEGEGDDDNDSDLEAELAALTGGSSGGQNKPKKCKFFLSLGKMLILLELYIGTWTILLSLN